MKMSIIYYSQSGKTAEMAEIVASGARQSEGMEVRCFDVDSVDLEYLEASDVVLFGTPTYYANMCWQLKKWFDKAYKINLSGKLGGAFATAQYAQGGADVALLTLVQHMLVKGMIVYAGGAVEKPFTHLGAVAVYENFEKSKEMFRVFGERMAKKAAELFAE